MLKVLMRPKSLPWIVAFVGLGVVLGGLGAYSWRPSEAPCGRYLNPLNACANAKEYKVFTEELRNQVNAQIEEDKARGDVRAVTVYFQTLEHDSWFSLRNDLLYFPASTAKLSLLMWFLSQGETNPSLLEKRGVYTWDDRNASQHFKYGGIQASTTYSVSELMESMIVNSDNNATALLELMLGEDDLIRIVTDFNFHPPTGSTGTTSNYRVDAKTLAAEFRALYNSSYLTPENSQKALDLLTRTKFDKGLRAGVPQEIPVAHKFGERLTRSTSEQQLHDCGIVYVPKNHYILCVMTQGGDPDVLARVIADISRTVYQAIAERQPI